MDTDPLKRCEEKLSFFRLRDLQELAGQLSISKQGKKQDIMDRILNNLRSNQGTNILNRDIHLVNLGPEYVETLIDSIISSVKKRKTKMVEEEQFGCKKEGGIVRCLCGSSLFLEPMIQCEDKTCGIWQHAGCVLVPDPVNHTFHIPPSFYCDICRVNRNDPFSETVAQILIPTKLVPYIASDGVNNGEGLERWFELSNQHMQFLRKNEYELQVWIILLNDEVQFRMHWPLSSEFHVNGISVKVLNRPGSQLLGINSRDNGALIKDFCKEGMNKISLTWQDTRTFCIGVRITKRHTINQVINMVSKEGEEESFEEALARVCRCIGGGINDTKNKQNNINSNNNNNNNADNDDDLELISDRATINLRCPIGGKRIKIAARFKPCSHMACFDLFTFIEINSHACKWQCPICLKNYCIDNLIIDSYFSRIASKLEKCDEDVTEIEVKRDGMWRIKCNKYDLPWYSEQNYQNAPEPEQNYQNASKPEQNYQNAPQPEPNNYQNTPLFMPNFTSFEENPILPLPLLNSNPQFAQFCGDYSANFSNPNLNFFGNWNPTFGNVYFPNQSDLVPISLATGIMQQVQVPVPVNEASSSIQNFCSVPNLGQLQNPGIHYPNLANNQHSFQNEETLMLYDNFSNPMVSELNHNTINPNFNFL